MKNTKILLFILSCALFLLGCNRQPQSAEPSPTFAPPPTQIAENEPAAEPESAAEVAVVPPTQSPAPVTEPTITAVALPGDGYPPPVSSPEITPDSGYPPPATPTAIVTTSPIPTQAGTATLIANYLPAIVNPDLTATPIPTNTPLPTATRTPTPTPFATLDFEAVRTEMTGRGVELATAKIGFHVGPGGNRNGFGEYMRRLDEAGVPFFLKSVSDADALLEAQTLIQQSGVPHVLVYRYADVGYDVPDYSLPPAAAAQKHWDLHMGKWPEALDRNLVWLETINEVDKERSEWLAEFALETAKLAEADGFKWAAFGWSSGEPEVAHWQGPQMQAFLRLAASRPEKLAIALHEYSYRQQSIEVDAPYLVGRFQSLFAVTDEMNIARPTVLITEWGWTYETVPDPKTAIEHIDWANRLYAPYPQVKGAAIWYLGPGYDGIADQTQKLIYPVMVYNLTHAYER